MTSSAERRPLEAERALLAGILQHPSWMPVAAASLVPADFAGPGAAAIFAAMLALDEQAFACTVDALRGQLSRTGVEGLVPLLVELGGAPPIAEPVSVLVETVQSAARRRRVAEVGRKLQAADSSDVPLDLLLRHAEEELAGLAAQATTSMRPMGEVLEESFDAMDRHAGSPKYAVDTGWRLSESETWSFLLGSVVVVHGLSRAALRTLAVDLLRCGAVERRLPIAYFTAERPADLEIPLLTSAADFPIRLDGPPAQELCLQLLGGVVADRLLARHGRA